MKKILAVLIFLAIQSNALADVASDIDESMKKYYDGQISSEDILSYLARESVSEKNSDNIKTIALTLKTQGPPRWRL